MKSIKRDKADIIEFISKNSSYIIFYWYIKNKKN